MFGGEIDPINGGFSNELILINEETLEMTTNIPLDDGMGLELKRGWSAGTSISKKRYQIVVFGGLTGNYDNPKRLNDLWLGTLTVK